MARLPRRILKHTATPIRTVEADAGAPTWVEGERGEEGPQPVAEAAFPCIVFLPNATESAGGESSWRPSRQIRRPTMLFDPALVPGRQPTRETELMILAPELAPWTGAGEARWQLDGDPQPFGPPGSVIGAQATLKQVKD